MSDPEERKVFLRTMRLADGTPTSGYPFDLPAVAGLAQIRFGQVTVLAGDNGTGKSTVSEAAAVAAGFNPEGGSRNLRFETHGTHSTLHEQLVLEWNQRPRWGWFLRAETFYGMATRIVTDDDPRFGLASMFPALHSESHGESFLDLALARFTGAGLYLLDEPESALSVHGQLKFLRIMHDACTAGAQFILATHSPLLMAFPGAQIWQLDGSGPTRVAFDDAEAVQLWRRILADPPSVLRHLFDD